MAEYTDLELEEGRELLGSFGLQLNSIERLPGGVANSSFIGHCASAPSVVVTILDNHDLASAQRLQKLTQWLITNGVRTPAILTPTTNRSFPMVQSKPTILRPFVEGMQPAVLSRDQAFFVGMSMAGYHNLAPPLHLELPTRRLPQDWEDSIQPGPPFELTDAVNQAAERLSEIDTSAMSLVHGDLFPDNMLWDASDSPHLLDWETASIDWPPLDLGFTIVGMSDGSTPPDGPVHSWELVASLLDGYASIGRSRPSVSDLRIATQYACAVLMFHRYLRHVIRFPDRDRAESWRQLLPMIASLQ